MREPESLARAVVGIIREISAAKRPLSLATLQEAFSTSEEILTLLYPVVKTEEPRRLPISERGLARVPLTRPGAPEKSNTENLQGFRNAFLKILDNLAPAVTGEFESAIGELQRKVAGCESSALLSVLGDQIGHTVGRLINETVGRMQFSNDFLVELGKDLHKMEEQLSLYRDFNRESSRIDGEFDSDLLSHANDLQRAIDSGDSPSNIRNVITSKMETISRAIEVKRQTDELRLQEADTKITLLQDNLRTYEQEIQQVKERSESLEKEVMLDELTQINNRRAYDLQIKETLRRYHRTMEHYSLLLIDVDHFKKINDQYGHKAGDKCLKEMASLAKSCLRQSDFFARYGGEELVAILCGVGGEAALGIAENIRVCIEKTRFHFLNKIILVSVSVGVTEILPSDTDPENVFIRVDQAMYQAKNEGRNRVRLITNLSFREVSDCSQK